MDFYQIKERSSKKGCVEVYPDFRVVRSKDLMVRGGGFYAIWDEEKQLWCTDEYELRRMVDEDLIAYRDRIAAKTEDTVHAKLMGDFSTNAWAQYRSYLGHIADNAHQLDTCLTFANTEVKKKDYVSRRLPYSLEAGECPAYEEILSTLYAPEERQKLEWAIGAIVAGDAKDIQKFVVLFGDPGTGKSTVLNIIQKLFAGYYTTFDSKALTSANNSFATEFFRTNPLVAIDHDTDLSRVEDNTKLNSIVSHEEMTVNEKHKPSYMARFNCFVFIGTNKPVKITDGKSGVIRRLIDVRPTGNHIPIARYNALMSRIDFELGAIANHCLEVYRSMGKNYYLAYRPLDMILRTDVFFNFVDNYREIFEEQNGVSLKQAYTMYKTYCDEASVEFKLPRHKFRDELRNYFEKFDDVTRVDGQQVRSYYSGLRKDKFTVGNKPVDESKPGWLAMDSTTSLFDELAADFPAQYASTKYEVPGKHWDENTKVLKDLDTKKLHYVKLPPNHIVIDFDLKDSKGEKSAEQNLEAACKWPPTYAEYSKSGKGIHLHYYYEGDISKLSHLYSEGIEVKTFVGDASLRRKLSKCNTIPVVTIKSGLPMKEEKVTINADVVKNEKGLRTLIKKALNKEIHANTKPNVDFIYQILEEAYSSGVNFDVSDLFQKVLVFANNSTHQSEACVALVAKMHFKSDEPSRDTGVYNTDALAFFDVEVFPNLFLVCWKYDGPENKCVVMINPTARDIEGLFPLKLIGFNNRRYDNHMLYARYVGYDNPQIFKLSTKIIKDEGRNGTFGEAYSISYTDIYDYSSKKQSLKKWQIELHIHHQELGLPFDQPVPEELWPKVVEYCCNDVESEEVVFHATQADFVARQILADLSGLTVNDTTQMHTARIMFGDDPRPQDKFVYTDLSVAFPGYTFTEGKSYYRGEETGEGGYVFAQPNIYRNVALLDVASMHPSSILAMNMFGPYTSRYKELLDARLAIKHGDFDKARKLLGGMLSKYLDDPSLADALAYALKIHALNIVYGLTSAKFANKFKDPRNVDNIVAKRGALFMIDLKHAVQEKGWTVAHIKTDSIKIPDATPEIIEFVKDFGEKYGYTFELEAVYDKFCLVNDAVYIARYSQDHPKHPGEWTATGAQFAHPFVFKQLFSGEPIVFEDLCETKTVTTSLLLDMNENLGPDEHNYCFVGRAGSFCPVKPGAGGGLLVREKEGKYYAATGSKGFRWMEAEAVQSLGKENDIDLNYFRGLVDDAVEAISKYGSFEMFRSSEPYDIPF